MDTWEVPEPGARWSPGRMLPRPDAADPQGSHLKGCSSGFLPRFLPAQGLPGGNGFKTLRYLGEKPELPKVTAHLLRA